MLIFASVGLWALLTLFTFVTVMRGVLNLPDSDGAEHLEGILAALARVSRWQNIASVLAAGFLFAGFFGSELETSIWPWPLLAWVALWLQLLWLRPHLGVYVEVLRRNVGRPVARLLSLHLAFDAVTLAALISVLAFGLR